jgi:hypothetical protein
MWMLVVSVQDPVGRRMDLTADQLRGAPAFSRDRNWDWSDRRREQELHDHYRAPYYWNEYLLANPTVMLNGPKGTNRRLRELGECFDII